MLDFLSLVHVTMFWLTFKKMDKAGLDNDGSASSSPSRRHGSLVGSLLKLREVLNLLVWGRLAMLLL